MQVIRQQHPSLDRERMGNPNGLDGRPQRLPDHFAAKQLLPAMRHHREEIGTAFGIVPSVVGHGSVLWVWEQRMGES